MALDTLPRYRYTYTLLSNVHHLGLIVGLTIGYNKSEDIGLVDELDSSKWECPYDNLIGDGFCDDEANDFACDFDGGDCVLDNYAHCYNRFWMGDNECDIYNNVTECNFDGGDCLGIEAFESKYPLII